jgi:hypothetical protein
MLYYGNSYDAFQEFMHYFHVEFNVYIVLLLIVAINCLKVIVMTNRVMPMNRQNTFGNFDMVTSLLACFGLFFAMIVQGIISDISLVYSQLWLGKTAGLMILALCLFCFQLVLFLRLRHLE